MKVAVRGLILKDNKILLVSKEKKYWVTPGGFVDKGESVIEALKREIKEELGLDVEEHNFYKFEEYSDEIRGDKLELYYKVQVKGNISFNDPDKQVFYAKYFNKQELKNITYYPSFILELIS